MTPSEIEILLHCHVSPEPHPREHAPAVREALNMFKILGAIEIDYTNGGHQTTEKGKKWVEMLCDTPEPVARFVDPRTEDILK